MLVVTVNTTIRDTSDVRVQLFKSDYVTHGRIYTISSFIHVHNSTVEPCVCRFQHKSLNMCDLIEKYTFT